MRNLFVGLCLAVTSATTAFAQSEWIEVGNFRSVRDTRFSTRLYARLIKSEWDSNYESKRLIFQINLEGKDIGAMEFDVLCKTGFFTFERKIPIPSGFRSGVRSFSSHSAPHFQQAKVVARDLFCSY